MQIHYTTTLTSKGQFTVPKPIRERLAVKKGVKFDIIPKDDGFFARPRRKSRIMEFAGFLASKDKGEPLKEIREKAQALAAKEIVAKFERAVSKYEHRRS